LAHFVEALRPAMAVEQQAPGDMIAAIYQRARKEGLGGAPADDGASVLSSARRSLAAKP
jgi:hypothetical protein